MGRTIVVVDDDQAFCTFLDEMLTDAGYKVHPFTDPDAALLAMRDGAIRPDVVVIDLVMPVHTGRDVMAALRGNSALRAIPVVLISALPVPNVGASMGAAAVLRKPFELNQLLEAVAHV